MLWANRQSFWERGGVSILSLLLLDLQAVRAWETDVASFLLEKGAKPNQRDRYGRSPLHIAAAVNYPDMIMLLVDNEHSKGTGPWTWKRACHSGWERKRANINSSAVEFSIGDFSPLLSSEKCVRHHGFID